MNRREFIKQIAAINAALAAAYCGVKGNEKKLKVVILGFDGANWPTIDPLINKGKLPYLEEFRKNSAWAYFKTFNPAKSNVVWTSIATGKTMMKHGIMDFAYLKKNGIKVPYSKSERKEPTLWQILDSLKRRSISVNWWVSHPPDKINGINVSDNFRRIATCQPDVIPGFADSVYPEAYFENLKQFIAENNDYQKVLARIGIQDFVELFKQAYPNGNYTRIPVLQMWEHFARHDAMIESVSDYLFDNAAYDLFATYFRFPDIIQHFVTHFMDKEFKKGLIEAFKTDSVTQAMRDEAIRQISDLLEPAYRYMESIIKKYVEKEKNQDTYFFIMSDHGFSLYPGGYNHYDLPPGYEAPDGFLMIHGPKVKTGMVKKAGVLDIAPTILYLMNLPVGKNMDGRVLKEVFKFNRKLTYKPYKLTQHGIMKRDENYDKESLEELKSIGYVD